MLQFKHLSLNVFLIEIPGFSDTKDKAVAALIPIIKRKLPSNFMNIFFFKKKAVSVDSKETSL